MSRGHGRWEQRLLRAASGAVVVPVSGIVRACVVSPGRSDYTSARRAAKSLAVKSQLSVLYAWSCPGCFAVQDRPDPEPCCKPARAMLAVCEPGRAHLLAHPAPAPGGQAPAWVSAARPAPAGLPLPTVDDLARLALQRLWEALNAGTITVNARDVSAIVRLAREQPPGGPRPGDERWQAAVRELLWMVRLRLGDGWPSFARDLRASQALRDLWQVPDP